MPAQQNYHSPEVDEIMGRIPGWIVRWGIAVIFAIFAGIIVMSGFISAPQTVTGEITLSSDNPAVQLSANASGRLTWLHNSTDSDSSISEETPIAYIGKYADYERVMRMETDVRGGEKRIAWPMTDSLQDELARRLIIAPISGRLMVTAGQYVQKGEPVAMIVPEGAAKVVGRMQVTAGYDQIRPGMKVWVRLSTPAVDKDRKLQGTVNRIMPLAGSDSDLVYVDFPDVAISLSGLLQVHQGQGEAEVVVRERSLLRKLIPWDAAAF